MNDNGNEKSSHIKSSQTQSLAFVDATKLHLKYPKKKSGLVGEVPRNASQSEISVNKKQQVPHVKAEFFMQLNSFKG